MGDPLIGPFVGAHSSTIENMWRITLRWRTHLANGKKRFKQSCGSGDLTKYRFSFWFFRLGFCHYKITNSVWKKFRFFSPRSVFCFGVFGVFGFFCLARRASASVFQLVEHRARQKIQKRQKHQNKKQSELDFFQKSFSRH